MDEFLNKEYSPSLWNKRLTPDEVLISHGQVLQSNSELAYKEILHHSIKFGPTDEQSLEIFYKNSDSCQISNDKINFNGKDVFVYIHGGYWQWGSVYWSSFMAKNFVEKDIVVIAIGHDLAPIVTLHEIINQIEIGISQVLQFAKNSNIYIGGHSAGGHLASLMLHTDFCKKFSLDISQNRIKGLILVSGIYDLTPLIKTNENKALKMDLVSAEISSPLFRNDLSFFSDTDKKNLKVLVVYGEHESSSFKKQSQDYYDHLKLKLGINNVVCEEIKGVDHFNLIEDIRHDDFELTKKIFRMIKEMKESNV